MPIRPANAWAAKARSASRLTLTVRESDRSSTTRTCTLPEPTNHLPALATAALSLLAAMPVPARLKPPQTVPVGASGRGLFVQPH
ncbi:hypothetical protein [Streptomyces sp. NPDC050121]|uniref:DinB/UmuC family translesion DNA polymerase n=1 Tax=Streptomyces sp. NPDC050121 TaxID=3365601 RepID=UPI00378F0A37